ncbi:MAG: hypothetical protein Q9166_007508 [cf. Caloplaca sp. 2 TL-2023]
MGFDFCKLRKNHDALHECNGCQVIGSMFEKRRENESKRLNNPPALKAAFHNNLQELRICANKCATCRVLYRAIWLRQITKAEADTLQSLTDHIWAQLPPLQQGSASHFNQNLLEIRVGDSRKDHTIAKLSCTRQQGTPSVNLCAERTHSAVIAEANGWLRICHDKHTECRNLGRSRRNPTNLISIDSTSGKLRLVEGSKLDHVDYVALSYTWGKGSATEDEEANIEAAQTKEENLHQRREGFPMAGLPGTVLDAIRLTLSLDLGYIWIDAICIVQPFGWNEEVSKMDEVYGNSYVTLATCSSMKATEQIPYFREAWRYKTGACRLYSGHWLANVDMPLNEIRRRSTLSTRAWTLQEERLTPRILYVCGQRMYWSCSVSQQVETGQKSGLPRLQGPDRFGHPQSFLRACRRQDLAALHEQWLELVKAFVKRNISYSTDRFPAIMGLAVQYLGPYADENGEVRGQEYLAGLWRRTFAQDLSWSVQALNVPQTPGVPVRRLDSVAPTWSWASIPVRSDIETQNLVEPTTDFELLEDSRLGSGGDFDKASKVVKRGADIKSVTVCGRFRRLLAKASTEKKWSSIVPQHNAKGKFDFSGCISEFIHAQDLETGQLVAYEPHKQEVVAQLDYFLPKKGSSDSPVVVSDSDLKKLVPDIVSGSDLKELACLQIGRSSMLLLRQYRTQRAVTRSNGRRFKGCMQGLGYALPGLLSWAMEIEEKMTSPYTSTHQSAGHAIFINQPYQDSVSMRVPQSSWQAKAKAKVIHLESRIPEEWVLTQAELDKAKQQKNLTGPFLEQYLSDRQVEIIQYDSMQLLEKIKLRQYTAVEVAQAYCKTAAIAQQIVSLVHMFLLRNSAQLGKNNCLHEIMFDFAMRTAEDLDQHLAKTGKVKGPLHGLPVSLKDQFHVKGYDTTMGYVGWIGTYEGDQDPAKVHQISSQVVDELLSLGAVLYCKVVLCAFQPPFAGPTQSNRHTTGFLTAMLRTRYCKLPASATTSSSMRYHEGTANNIRSSQNPGQTTSASSVGVMGTSIEALKLVMTSILSTEPWNHDPNVVRIPWNSEAETSTLSRAHSDGSAKEALALKLGFFWSDGVVNPHPPVSRGLRLLHDVLQNLGHKGAFLGADGAHDIHRQLDLSGEPLIHLLREGVVVVPVTKADKTIDKFYDDYQPLNETDRKNWKAYDSEVYDGAPVGLQIVARKWEEEKVWAIAKIINDALNTAAKI